MKQANRILTIFFALIAIVFSASAQMKPGTLMLGTTIGSTVYSNANSDYNYDIGGTKSTSTHTYTFSAGPQIGVFITKRVVLGGNLSLSYSDAGSTVKNLSSTNVATGSTSTTNTLSFSLGPFMRYYFSNLKSRNWFFAQLSTAAGTGSGASTGTADNTTTTSTSNGKVSNIFNWNAGGSLGMTHLFVHRIAMDFSLGYNYAHQKNYDTNETITTKTSTGLVSTSTNNYSLATGTAGVTATVGFHFFL